MVDVLQPVFVTQKLMVVKLETRQCVSVPEKVRMPWFVAVKRQINPCFCVYTQHKPTAPLNT